MNVVALNTALADVKARSVYFLANEADCSVTTSDVTDSGTAMLIEVRDAVVELVESNMGDKSSYFCQAVETEDPSQVDYDGAVHMIADGAVSIWTGERWEQFTSLRAWTEDPTDIGFEFGPDGDMEKAAGCCVFLIADRLARSLVDELVQAAAEDPED